MTPPRFSHFMALALATALVAGCASPPGPAPTGSRGQTAMDVEQIKAALVGEWVSIAPEIRPSAARNADGTPKPFHLKREFRYLPGDRFELTVVNSADPNGAVAIARIVIKGHMLWRGAHPIAAGAQKVDFVADEAYDVTPLHARLRRPAEPGRGQRLPTVASRRSRRASSARRSRRSGWPKGRTSWSSTSST